MVPVSFIHCRFVRVGIFRPAFLIFLRTSTRSNMPPKKQKRPASSDSDSDSGPDDKGPAPPKKPASKPGPKGDNGDESFLIEKTKFATVREFKGNTYVDIREYYEKDGNLLPGKKGISLTATQYQKLKDLIPQIDEALSKR